MPRKTRPKPMTAKEFRRIRERLGMTQIEMGRVLGCKRQMIIRYEQGHRPIPFGRADHLRLILQVRKTRDAIMAAATA